MKLITKIILIFLFLFYGKRVYGQGFLNAKTDTIVSPIVWNPIIPLSIDSINYSVPSLKQDGPKVFILFGKQFPGGSNYNVYYVTSNDYGNSWVTQQYVIHDTEHTSFGTPFLTSSAQNLYIIWKGWREVDDTLHAPPVRFLRSSDWGEHWMPEKSIASVAAILSVSALYPAIFISMKDSAGRCVLTRSTDYGNIWNQFSMPPNSYSTLVSVPSGLHAASSGNEIRYYRSENFGETWEAPQYLSLVDNFASDNPCLAGDYNENLYIIWLDGKYGGDFSGTILLRRSTDGGANWLPEKIISQLSTAVQSNIATWQNNVIVSWVTNADTMSHLYVNLSTDQGEHWSGPINVAEYEQIDGANVSINDSIVYLCWCGRVQNSFQIYFRKGLLPLTGVVNDVSNRKLEYEVENLYPNPFNSSVTINYIINKTSKVHIDIITILGQTVQTLESNTQTMGRYTAYWNGRDFKNNNCNSGIYFCRIRADKLESTYKILLIK